MSDIFDVNVRTGQIFEVVSANKCKTFEAPSGYVFEMLGYTFTLKTTGNNYVVVLEKPLLQTEQYYDVTEKTDGVLICLCTDSAHNAMSGNLYGIRTRYLTICPRNATAFSGTVNIYYRLAEAQTDELVYEYARKKFRK